MKNKSRVLIPKPFRDDEFSLLRTGIYDDSQTRVFMNEARDFAYLDPIPFINYEDYKPRAQTLYSKTSENRHDARKAIERKKQAYAARLKKVESVLFPNGLVLEIGAGDAGFLAYAKSQIQTLNLSCVEPDKNSKAARDKYSWLLQYESIDQVERQSLDFVMAYHVLEHIHDPAEFLDGCRRVLKPTGQLIIEVPSLTDPLLTVYKLPEYEAFFYQKQHPYYYSLPSLHRLLAGHDFVVNEMIPHQRYGLENHLQWIRHATPGGSDVYREIFKVTDNSYRLELEASDHADTAIVIAGVEH